MPTTTAPRHRPGRIPSGTALEHLTGRVSRELRERLDAACGVASVSRCEAIRQALEGWIAVVRERAKASPNGSKSNPAV